MPNYRIYSLDPRGRIVLGIDVVCADDDAAADLAAARFVHPIQFEIWEGARLVRAAPTTKQPWRLTQMSEVADPTGP